MLDLIKKQGLNYLILGFIFLIPLVWSRYLNANYFSAKFFLVYLISSFSLFASSRRLVWPKLPAFVSATFIALLILHLTSPLVSGELVHVLYFFKFFSFVCLTYYFYSIEADLLGFVKKYDFIFLAVTGFILVFAFSDFYTLRVQNSDITIGFLLGSFGNVNMLSEFLILTLPLVHFWSGLQTKIPKAIKLVILFGWFFFLFYCRSRSAWIGLGLWALWSIVHKKLSLMDALLLVASLACYHLAFLLPYDVNASPNIKGESFRQRLHLYVTTLQLIRDHPFGIGVGQFFSKIIPYFVGSDFKPMEYVYFDQPHSEILKWAAQFGWVGFVLPPIVISYLGYTCVKTKNFFLTSSLVVFVPQVAFQFPFENPASLLYLAFLFAMSLRLFPEAKSILLSIRHRLVLGVLALVGMAHAFAFVTSIYLETSHGNNLDTVIFSCEIYPVNITACFNRAQYLLVNRKFVEARLAMIEDFSKFPFHAGLMRLLPSLMKGTSTDQKVCESVLEYNYVFNEQKFFNSELLKSCGTFKIPVVHHDPKQFEADYLNWQKLTLH